MRMRMITHGENGDELARRSRRRNSMMLMNPWMSLESMDISLPVCSKILEATTLLVQGEMWRHSTGDMC